MPKLTYRDKIFKHKLTVIYRNLLIVALVIVVAVVVKIQFDNKVYTETEILYDMDKVGAEGAIYKRYNGNILVYSDDGMSAYNENGEQIWNKTYEMQDPIVDINEDFVAVGDYRGSNIYIMNKSGITGEVETNMPILDLSVSSKGVVSAILQDDAVTWIKLFSSTGESIANLKTTMKQSGYPVAANISADNIKLGVSYLKTQSGEINTSVAFYNFGDVGQNTTDHLVSGYDYKDTVIPFLAYLNEDYAVALSEEEMFLYKGKEKPALEKKVTLNKEIQSVYYDNTSIALISRNTESEKLYCMDLYDLKGDLIFSEVFDIEYQDIILDGGNILIYSDSEVLILNRNGKTKYKGDFGGDIVAIMETESRTKFIVVRGDKIEMVKLH